MGTKSGAELADELINAEQPGEVAHAAGRWLAANLADCGFDTWLKSEKALRRRNGTRAEKIWFQTSTDNRAGQDIVITGIGLLVQDRGIRCDPARPGRTETDTWTCTTRFDEVLDYGRQYTIDLSAPRHRVERLDTFARSIREVGIPWFTYTRNPLNVTDIPERLLDGCLPALIDWLLAIDATEPARILLERWLALGSATDARPAHRRPPPWRTTAFDRGQAIAAADGEPSTDAEWLGWIASRRLNPPARS
ncbi:hypothetical protein DFR70_1011005 [Nocardia tenerifensis]|uniref:Uncharacterized protein n=1 Tax=Nocardia tenerifensis TaxID=228006 RepID=A0A318KAJ0_9NOCA|nr:hypothetical protein [Nocardia tenerifensis]PXX71571.1 hypothetical protein DFR70_1011005 [Nocardia tenerifensis]